jgi:hypothetical protein
MDSDFTSDIPNRDRYADALDRALDDFVRGNRRRSKRLESNMGTTVDRVFALAEVGGMSGAGLVPGRPVRKLIPWPMRQIVSVASTVAVVVILAVGINATFPGFRDQSTGLGTSIATMDAEDDQISVHPLVPDDCRWGSRSREELHEILGIVPSDNDLPDMIVSDSDADPAVLDSLDETLRAWQACARYNDTFGAMTLESEGFIRRKIYPDLYTVDPYSDATIDEILDGFERTDEVYGARTPEPGEPANEWPVLMIDRTRPITVSEDGTRIDAYVNSVSIVDASSQDVRGGDDSPGQWDSGFVMFVFEDGVWRIAVTERDLLLGIRYPSEHFIGDKRRG